MSHKATTWLSGLTAREIGHSEFRVLFHLCDCHNPSQGCFPTQAYLIEACGVSNGTLNAALASLEAKGFLARHRSVDKVTKRQRPTRYMLGFELAATASAAPPDPSPKSGDGSKLLPTPKTGDGSRRHPTPKSGDGTVSSPDPEPSPVSGPSRLRPAGDKPVIEPVNNRRARSGGAEADSFWAERIADPTGYVAPSSIRPAQARRLLEKGLVTEQQLRARSITF